MAFPVWYIHGAFASPASFTWLKEQLPQHDVVNVEYSCGGSLSRVLEQVEERANSAKGPFDIIGHSLGGVLGVVLANRCPNVRKVVTIASPFGGSRIAAFLQFITPGNFMQDVQPLSPIMLEARQTPRVPVLSVVTTGGRSPALPEANDGVVTLTSQTALLGPTYVERPVNHFEVLMDSELPKLIGDFLWR